MADFGYDVADHCGVDPVFGTLDDFDRMLSAAHDVGLKLWISSRTTPRTDTRDSSRAELQGPAPSGIGTSGVIRKSDGGPPNNWLREFGGPAWTLDPRTGQYYYHAYLDQQPHLNWRNPAVSAAMLDVLRFWLARGVDGFRVDAIHHLFEDEQLRDNPADAQWRERMSPARRLLRV
jgi:alpha-glucosidase